MRYTALNHYLNVTGIAECARAELEGTTAGAPDRVCVVPGDIAWDSCECGQLAVNTGPIYPSSVFPLRDDEGISTNCGIPQIAVEVNVSILRCVPVADGSGNPPICDALSAAELTRLQDAEAVFKSVMCCLIDYKATNRITEWTIQGQDPLGPEGMCAGTELHIRLGYLPLCCGN